MAPSVVEQAALAEIGDQCGRCLVGVAALPDDLRRQLGVLIPPAMEKLNEPHAALGQSAGEQAIGGERAGRSRFGRYIWDFVAD